MPPSSIPISINYDHIQYSKYPEAFIYRYYVLFMIYVYFEIIIYDIIPNIKALVFTCANTMKAAVNNADIQRMRMRLRCEVINRVNIWQSNSIWINIEVMIVKMAIAMQSMI